MSHPGDRVDGNQKLYLLMPTAKMVKGFASQATRFPEET